MPPTVAAALGGVETEQAWAGVPNTTPAMLHGQRSMCLPSLVKTLMKDFKGFALSGNVVDLALGVIIGAAFAAVVQSFADNVLMGFIGALFGKPNFDQLTFSVGKGTVEYGKFLSTLVSFLIIAFVLLMLVKGLMRVGMNFRAQGSRECDFCKEFVAVDASRCKFCTSSLVPVVPD
jgi:large conductance mechanosensitive channel